MKIPIIILHGWGKQGSDYLEVQNMLESSGFKVLAPDLPGFGREKLTKPVMVLNDYIEFVLDFIKKNKLKQVILIGHSFGGRISAKLIANNTGIIKKVVITGAPLIKQPLSLRKKILSKSAKAIKNFIGNSQLLRKILYRMIGEWDYFKANPHLKETFKEIIAEDLQKYLEKISVPTLVIWGSLDIVVSPSIGKEIAKRIPSASYIEIPNATHKLPYEKPAIFTEKIIEFINK